jgi:hypothetical protein
MWAGSLSHRSLSVSYLWKPPADNKTLIYNKLKTFGIEIVSDTLIGLKSRIDDALANRKRELKDIADGIRGKYTVLIDEDGLLKTAAMKYAIAGWAKEYDLDGVAVACETDIHGAISSVIAQAAAGWKSPSFLADMTVRHPDNENAELL